MTTIALLLISDGRDDYLQQTLNSAEQALPDFDQTIHIDDAGHHLGFAGAIQAGWDQVETDLVFHLEQDFTFNRPVPIRDMAAVLDAHPYLTQLALLRQPWNDQEREAGGVMQMHPGDYRRVHRDGQSWFEHRRHFTTNPSLYPAWITGLGWPQCQFSEGHFGIALFNRDPALRAAYWGDGDEWVEHVGNDRIGKGY